MEQGAYTYVTAALVGYACGAVPFGVLAAWLRGVDITAHGSGNIGATNVGRVLGPWTGRLVLLLDILKGFLPVLFFLWYYRLAEPGLKPAVAAGLCSIAGHIASPLLLFRGGKGVATTVGVFAALLREWILLPLAVWVVMVKATRYVSAGSMVMVLSLPLAAWLRWRGNADAPWVAGMSGVVAVVVIFRHRANIRRLLQGEEHRYGEQKTGTNNSNETPGKASEGTS